MVSIINSRSLTRSKSPRPHYKSKSKSPKRAKARTPLTYKRNRNNGLGNNPLSVIATNLLATPRSRSPIRNGLGINPLFKISANLFATTVRNNRPAIVKKTSTLRISKNKSPKYKIRKHKTPRTYKKKQLSAK
jgi:hypothetical protein